MSKISFLILLIILLIPAVNQSQELDYDFLENILEEISIETGSSPELDAIEKLLENPIYLRTATIEEFLRIPGFTTSEARSIIQLAIDDTTLSHEKLFSIIELSDVQKYLLILCTTFELPSTSKKKLIWRTRYKDYLREPRGFTQDKFKGDELDLYNRLTGYYEGFSFGLLTDKDAGEVYLADYYSGYVSGELSGFKFLFGDYYIETGMGNILWKSFPVYKGAEVIYPTMQRGSGIKEYRSSIDYRLFRGAAFEKSFSIFNSNLKFIAWYSKSNKSGTIDKTGENISSVYRSGYYRTESEISKKDAFNEVLFGSNIEWKNENLSIGFTAMRLQYDKLILSESKYAFYGKEGNMFSVYSFFDLSNFSLGAEFSSDANGNAGFKTGSQYKTGYFELAMNLRSFTPNFRSQYGMNFGESSAPNNEYGLYTGIRFKGIKDIVLSSYADFYASYERTYYVPEPIHGIDLFFQTDWKLNSRVKVIFRISNENKTDAMNDDNNEKVIFQKEKFRVRGEINYKLLKSLSLRLRMEANRIGFKNLKPDEKGVAGFIEMRWLQSEYIQTGCRISAFSTPSFESVVYQYELAMPGYMTTPPMYGDGFRSFIFVKLSLLKDLDLWFRYSITKKNNVESIGSGYLEIPGNRDERLMLQLDARL